MKTKLFLAFALMFFSINLLADDNVKKTTTVLESNTVEETVIYDQKTNEPLKKVTCELNSHNQVILKTVYKKDKFSKWIPDHKFDMTYETVESNTPKTVTYTKWNAIREKWEYKSKTQKCHK